MKNKKPSKMREILHLQVGQGGNHIGAKVSCCSTQTNALGYVALYPQSRDLPYVAYIGLYITALPYNLSPIACFLTIIFYKVVWQHIQGVVGF